jgi:hypothetical protein
LEFANKLEFQLGVFEGLDGSAEIVTLGRGVGKFFGALDVGILVGFFVGPMVPTCKNAYARNSSLFFANSVLNLECFLGRACPYKSQHS